MESEDYANPDQLLLDAIRSGEDAALERLFALHEVNLYALCRGVLGHAEDAEDAVQETFLRALPKFAGFRGDSTVRTWLTRIAVNVCLEWKRSRRPSVPLLEECSASTAATSTLETSVLQQQSIREALMNVAPRHRTMFLLKELEGWTVAEIAMEFRCTQRRVYHGLSMAYRSLADWRERCDREGE